MYIYTYIVYINILSEAPRSDLRSIQVRLKKTRLYMSRLDDIQTAPETSRNITALSY